MHYLQIQSYDGADIDGNVSEISATSYLPLSDITDLDEFPTFETDNCASTTQIISRSTRNGILCRLISRELVTVVT